MSAAHISFFLSVICLLLCFFLSFPEWCCCVFVLGCFFFLHDVTSLLLHSTALSLTVWVAALTFCTVQKRWPRDLQTGVRGKALDGMFQERLCINSSVVTDWREGEREREGWLADGGRDWVDDEQPHWQQHLRSAALRLSAVTGNRPGLRQLDFINSPVLAARACCRAILPNGRTEFADLLGDRSSHFTNNLVKLPKIGVHFEHFFIFYLFFFTSARFAAEARAEERTQK